MPNINEIVEKLLPEKKNEDIGVSDTCGWCKAHNACREEGRQKLLRKLPGLVLSEEKIFKIMTSTNADEKGKEVLLSGKSVTVDVEDLRMFAKAIHAAQPLVKGKPQSVEYPADRSGLYKSLNPLIDGHFKDAPEARQKVDKLKRKIGQLIVGLEEKIYSKPKGKNEHW